MLTNKLHLFCAESFEVRVSHCDLQRGNKDELPRGLVNHTRVTVVTVVTESQRWQRLIPNDLFWPFLATVLLPLPHAPLLFLHYLDCVCSHCFHFLSPASDWADAVRVCQCCTAACEQTVQSIWKIHTAHISVTIPFHFSHHQIKRNDLKLSIERRI